MKTKPTPKQLSALRVDLHRLFAERKVWKSPMLSRDLVARMLGINAETLRAVLKLEGKTFNQYVKGYRVEEACRLAAGGMKKHKAAEMAGFGSYVKFD